MMSLKMKTATAKVEIIEIVRYAGTVWNLETEHEEYVAEGVVVHNCPHVWDHEYEKRGKMACADLWMGE